MKVVCVEEKLMIDDIRGAAKAKYRVKCVLRRAELTVKSAGGQAGL